MAAIIGALQAMFWQAAVEEEEEEEEPPLEKLAKVATAEQRKRERSASLRRKPRMTKEMPLNVANEGVARMLSVNRVSRIEIDEEHSALRVYFKHRERRQGGRFRAREEEEEYPYLGGSIDDLTAFVASQGIEDVGTLASLFPAGFWNAIHLLGKDFDVISQEMFK